VVLVHGFTQSARSFDRLAEALSPGHQVLAIDAPGHGRSGGVRPTGFAEAAALVGAAGGRATYLGYSMGGRLCLRLALDRPDLVTGLVLVSATAGIEDDEQRAARRASDGDLAARLDPQGSGRTGGGEPLALEAFLDQWLAGPLFSGLTPEARGLDDRLGNTTTGLASSLRSTGTGEMDPLWHRLGELKMPVAVIAGGADAKFSSLAARIARGVGQPAELHLVPGCGHAVPWERPAELETILAGFLARHGG
jgi:2-succinyl-6-hydroxy-2,4-cyclohexadiene-1-carboxylate synthase